MIRTVTLLLLAVVLAAVSGCVQSALDAGVPTLSLCAEWPEQRLKNNIIHKTRVPRGGTFEVIARIDAKDVLFYRWQRSRINIKAEPELKPTAVLIDGVIGKNSSEPLVFKDLNSLKEVHWRFQLPWEVRKAEPEYTFEVTVTLPGRYADLRKSITVDQGVSCYDTTFTTRLRELAGSDYCRLESIGRSSFGREMYFLRVTDFSIPLAKKKPFVMIGAYHGNEPSGHASILDFVHELITKPENRRYLKTCVLYIVPCMSPDGREAGFHDHPNGTEMNHCFEEDKLIPEATNVMAVLQKYKGTFANALGMTTHQWGRPYLLLSHDCREKGDWSDRLMKNVGIRISNEMDEYVHVQSHPPRYAGYSSVRSYMFSEIGIPSFVLEDAGGGRFNIGRQMKNVIREMRIYYAILDQMIAPHPVKPKVRPPKKTSFPSERNYRAYKVAKAPKIDGKLDEACWRRKSVITGFKTGGRRPVQKGQTTVHVVYDDRNLYVAYAVPDLKPSKIKGHDPKPGIWTEDGCDFMLDTNLNRWSYFQFQANANGAFSDGYWPIPGIPDSNTFNVGDYEAAGSVENGAIEIRIPFTAFNGHPEMLDPEVPSPPKPGTVWGVNFFRNGPSTSWAPSGPRGGAHTPWLFNAMTFTGETK